MLGDLAAQENLLFLLAEGQRPQSLIPHSQTILRASSVARSMSLPAPVVIWFEEDFFGHPSAHQEGNLLLGIVLGVVVPFFVGSCWSGPAPCHAE